MRLASISAEYAFVLLPLALFAGLYAGAIGYEERFVEPFEVFSFDRLDFLVSLVLAAVAAILGGLMYALNRIRPRHWFAWLVGVVLCAVLSFWVGTGMTARMVF